MRLNNPLFWAMHIFLRILVAFSLAFCLVGCQSMQQRLSHYSEDFRRGAYSDAAQFAEDAAGKKDGDQLLWRLMAGNARLLEGETQQGIDQLDVAEDIFHANDTRSVYQQTATNAAAMLRNEAAFPYQGQGQERLFCCLYKGLAYAETGNRNAARTEFNRAADHQETWLFERRKEIAAAAENLREEAAEGGEDAGAGRLAGASAQTDVIMGDASFCAKVQSRCGFDPQSGGKLGTLPETAYTNVYLAHLVGVFRWLNGDGGRGYLKDAGRMAPQNPQVAEDLAEAEAGKTPREQVWIYVEDGMAPRREVWRLDLPLALIPGVNRYVDYAGIALPYLVQQECGADGYSAGAEGAELSPMPMLEDMDRLFKTEYEVYMREALPREITRTLLKVSAQAALGIAENSANSDGARLSMRLLRAGTAVWAATTNNADVRSWLSLPKRVYMMRLERPENGRIALQCRFGGMVETKTLEVPPGNAIVWVRKSAPRGAMTIRKIAFAVAD